MTPKQAGWRVVLLSLPFLGFGLWWALSPPLGAVLGANGRAVVQTLGAAMAILGVAAAALGVWLVGQDEDRVM